MRLLLILWSAIPLFLFAQQAATIGIKSMGAMKIPDTEEFSFHSKKMNQEFRIYVKLPMSYHDSVHKKYPVFYFTDANRVFPLVTNTASLLEFPMKKCPDMIVVGIGYPIRDMADWTLARTRDLTPYADQQAEISWQTFIKNTAGRDVTVKSGGADVFLEFIKSELIPFIESTYRAGNKNRALGGYSYGGLFTIYAMFKSPGTFTRYYAGSPSLRFARGAIFNDEEAFSLKNKDLRATLFMTVGEKEPAAMIEDVRKMSDALNTRKYPGFKMEARIFEGEDHQSGIPVSVMRAMSILCNVEN